MTKSTRRRASSAPRARSSGSASAGTSKTDDVYREVTDRIIAALESGTVPWRTPWIAGAGRPMRMSDNSPYQGVNVLLLGLTAADRGYSSPWWGTFEQIKSRGGNVREGQNKANGCGATRVTLWKTFTPRGAEPDDDGNFAQIPMARMFPVFNADQCENLPAKYYPAPRELSADEAIAGAEAIITGYISRPYSPLLVHDIHTGAHFDHQTDTIHVPTIAEHISAGRYYSTAFHEMTHSTGHHSRLARRAKGERREFGSHVYGAEELIAEMGAAMLCADAGISNDAAIADQASYIASWLKTIREDHKLVVSAASAAGKACAHIHGAPASTAAADDGAEPEIAA